MLTIGQKAPAFRLESSLGGEVTLASLGGTTLVLYFYPRDNTPGCTREAQDFRDAAAQFSERGAVVLGVSRDSVKSHQKFADKFSLGFALLSDPDGKMIEDYGAWGEKNMYGRAMMGIIRSTVIVGADGRVLHLFPKVKVAGHVEEVLAALDGEDGASGTAKVNAKGTAKKPSAKAAKPPAKAPKPSANTAKPTGKAPLGSKK